MVTLTVLFAFALVVGFGAGRVHHPANLKLAAIKAEIAKTEAEFEKQITLAGPAIIARIKAVL